MPTTRCPIRVLLLEDNSADAALLRALLAESPGASSITLHVERRLSDGISRLQESRFDVVLLDLGLPDSQGMETLRQLKAQIHGIAIVVLTGLADEAIGLEAVHRGAQDFLVKGEVDARVLIRIIRYAIERQQAQRSLQESQDRLALAIDVADLRTWDWDLQTGKVVGSYCPTGDAATSRLDRVTDFSSFFSYVHTDDREENNKKIADAMENQRDYQNEMRIVWPDGTTRWVQVKGRFFYNGHRKPIRMIGALVDLTEHKRAEEAMKRHADEVMHLARVSLMGQMASGLAHELNQPLGAIVNYASVVLMQLEAGKAPAPITMQAIQEVIKETRRAGSIISRLRSFVSKQDPRRGMTSVRQLLEETLHLLAFELRHQQIRPAVNLADDLPLVLADAIQIEQVLINLIYNALEAMDGANSPVRNLSVEAGIDPENTTHAFISVIDSGPGVEPEHMRKLFDAFFTTKKTGLGMGLNICRTIVESHGGRLTARRNPTGGMCFTLTLPFKEVGDP